MTGLKSWDGGGDQDRWNLESPYFYTADHTGPVTKGYRPRRGFSVLQPSVVVVGGPHADRGHDWPDPSIGTLQMP